MYCLVVVGMFRKKFLYPSSGSQYEEIQPFVVFPRNGSYFLDPGTGIFSSSFGS